MMEALNRREFLKLSTLAGTGLTLGGILGFQPGKILALTAAMNESGLRTNITPIAITEDCAQLVVHSSEFSKRIKEILTGHWAEMRIGGILRSGEKHAVALLNSCRSAIKSDPVDEFSAKKIAFAAGWLFHRAANQQLYASPGREDTEDQMERMIYHDAYLLRENFSSDGAKVESVFSLFKSLEQRTLLRQHTFVPDERDIDSWVPNLVRWHRDNETLLRRYAQAYSAPDPEKMRRFVHNVDFYDSADPVIRLARSLHEGVTERAIDLNAAVEKAASQSQYAQALHRGFCYMQATNDYFKQVIDEKTLRNRLQIA